eukprot:6700450-Prymnesium_polylepis.1
MKSRARAVSISALPRRHERMPRAQMERSRTRTNRQNGQGAIGCARWPANAMPVAIRWRRKPQHVLVPQSDLRVIRGCYGGRPTCSCFEDISILISLTRISTAARADLSRPSCQRCFSRTESRCRSMHALREKCRPSSEPLLLAKRQNGCAGCCTHLANASSTLSTCSLVRSKRSTSIGSSSASASSASALRSDRSRLSSSRCTSTTLMKSGAPGSG